MAVGGLAPHLDSADRAPAFAQDDSSTWVSQRRWPTRTCWVTRTRVPGGNCGFGGEGIMRCWISRW